MIDKPYLLKRYEQFIDEEGLLIKSLDQLIHAEKHFDIQVTEFLTPDLIFVLCEIVNLYTDLKWMTIGVFKDAERQKCLFYQGYETVIPEDYVSLIEVKYNQKFVELSHRDALGALMSLGIKRSKLGDICVFDGGFQIAVDKSLLEYFLFQIEKIGRSGVVLSEIPLDHARNHDILKKTVSGTVKSIRLDSILALAFSISRATAQDLIRAERVKLNYSVKDQVDIEPKENDLISVRGYGRFTLDEVIGLTKKDRLRVKLSIIGG